MNQNTSVFFDSIRKLLEANEFYKALRLLRSLLHESPKLNEAIQQSARYEDICQQVRLGIVGHAEATLNKNQIRWNLLELLDLLERQDNPQAISPLLTAIEQTAAQPPLQLEVAEAMSIVDSKNVVTGNISAGGNVTIGDTTTVSESQASRRLRLFLYLFVPMLAIAGAVLWYFYQEMQRPLSLKVRLENRTLNPELPEPSGTLSLTYGSKTEPKTEITTETLFEGIPANFKGEQVRLQFFAKGFLPVDTIFYLDKETIELPVHRNHDLGRITGIIYDGSGRTLEGVKVSLTCCAIVTDASGTFVLEIPFQHQRTAQRIDVFKEGYSTQSLTTPVVPGEAVRLILEKQ